MPFRLMLGRDAVVLGRGARLFPHHIDPNRTYVFDRPLALVDVHPQDPSIIGLRNLTDRPWSYRTPDGSSETVGPGRTVRLLDRLEIDFGRRRGTVAAFPGSGA